MGYSEILGMIVIGLIIIILWMKNSSLDKVSKLEGHIRDLLHNQFEVLNLKIERVISSNENDGISSIVIKGEEFSSGDDVHFFTEENEPLSEISNDSGKEFETPFYVSEIVEPKSGSCSLIWKVWFSDRLSDGKYFRSCLEFDELNNPEECEELTEE